jgi:hypothetical protein
MAAPLRMVFHGAPPAADADGETLGPLPPPLVEVTLYSDDSVAFGRMALTASRVTDLLNEGTEFELVNTFLQALDDSHGLQVRTVVVRRDEIFAVGVTGPRGDLTRRTRTRQIPVEVRVGRYDVSGNIHVIPGTDPIIGFRRRRVMVPLTEATIEFDTPDGGRLARFGTILVNRDLTDWIAPARRSDVRPPELIPELHRARRGLRRPTRPPWHEIAERCPSSPEVGATAALRWRYADRVPAHPRGSDGVMAQRSTTCHSTGLRVGTSRR